MSMTWLSAVDTIRKARNQAAGKPIQNNTRLFQRGEGDEREFGIVLHGTEVVTIHSDGTYTLRNGGYNTVTTLDRIRRWSPMTWQQLLTERGDWYIRLQPNPADPRPERVERTIPKPYEADNPGDEPVKGTEGCVAGQMVTTEHRDEIVEIYRRHLKDDEEVIEVVDKGFSDDGRYDRVKVKRSWDSHVYVGEWAHASQDDGWRALPDNGPYSYGGQFTNDDGETVKYVQCSHCKAFDDEHEAWRAAMHGPRWGGRRFDGPHRGYKTYAAMMESFGSQEAWQEAYIIDFRARRDYLKADREWDQRNRVPFYDGIKVDSEGYAFRLREKGPSPAKLRRHEAAVAKMRKRIDKFIAGYIEALKKGMPMPSGGDCWYCLMRASNESGQSGNFGDMAGSDHLLEHFKDRYYVPSLAVNALRERGYKDVGIYMWLDMNQDTQTMGGRDQGAKAYDTVRRDLRKFLQKRLIPTAPTS